MRVLVTGASGLLGSALLPLLAQAGHECVPLRRGRSHPDAPHWDPAGGHIDLQNCGRLDAVVHLAGENIATRWTAAKKERIRASRVDGTRLLCRALAGLEMPPAKLISASATGFYGDRGAEKLDERSARGNGFLPDLCGAWEEATVAAQARGIQVIHLRTGVVLTTRGGALAKMLPAFKLGLGGRIGNGKQILSWIALDDALRVIQWLLQPATAISGPLNNVTPHPVTNEEFTRTLGRVLSRPTILPVPAVMLRAAFGGMADEALLASAHVTPALLCENHFAFRYPLLEPALRYLLAVGRSAGVPPAGSGSVSLPG